MATTIDRLPCLDPEKTASRASKHPAEIKDRCSNKCGQYIIDDNYKSVGLTISEFEHERANGVLAILNDLPLDERHINYGEKAQEILNLWARPTINWKM